MEFVRIPAGSFYIKPAHQVQFTKPFYMGKYEVTQAQWEAVMGTTVSQQHKKANSFWHLKGVGPDYPIYYVSCQEAAEFCKRLGKNFRLPDESEWEYACRAGSKTHFYYGDDPNYSQLDSYEWYYDNSEGSTHPVGQKKPNKWGLYDMYGNVSEWCSKNICRGGHWITNAKYCHSSSRYSSYKPHDILGFRVVFAGNLDSDKKVLKIALPENTAGLNIALEKMPNIKPVTRMAIKGVVQDDSGTQIDNVNMRILPGGYWYLRKYPEGRFEAHLITKSSESSKGKYHLLARHIQRNLVAFKEFDEDVNNLDIRFEQGAILVGKVVDPSGKGIQNAKIHTIMLTPDGNEPLSPVIVEPDIEGKIEIKALPLGQKYRLGVRALGYRVNQIEIISGNIPGKRIDIGPILLDRGQFSVSGIVVDRKGKPVFDAWIYCTGEKQIGINSHTDAKGRFKADGIFEGPVILYVYKKEESSGLLWSAEKHTYSGATNVKIALRHKTYQNTK